MHHTTMASFQIPFNKPYLTGKEAHYMYQAVYNGKLSGNGEFTKRCQQFFEQRYGFRKCLLTTSGTDALEMCAMLCDLQLGDEVIIPSYTFVSTALAFLREGAKVVFADSMSRNPNLDAETLESLITPRTKVIVPVHYAGVACDMDTIMAIAQKHNLLVVEDAAQAIDSYYKPLTPNPFPRNGEGEQNPAERFAPYGERGRGIGALPDIPDYATNNAHMFYLIMPDLETRTVLIKHLKEKGILAVFHYLSLHSSAFYLDKHDGRALPNCDRYADTLVRLPMYYDMSLSDVEYICDTIAQLVS